jgi:predicted Rossmann-fold nucleotide-binding protein
MTDEMKKQAEAFQEMLAGGGPVGRMGAVWAEAMTEMGSEVLGFMSERLRQDADVQKKMMQCKDFGELAHVQATFMQEAIDQYTAETGKLVEIGSDAMRKVGLDPDA